MGFPFPQRGAPRRASLSGKRARFRRLVAEPLEDRRLLAAFTPGNLVAYRVGTVSGFLTSETAPVFLDEFDTNPASPTFQMIVQSVELPTAASGTQRALTARGTGTAEGLMTRSTDGRYLVLTGYDAAPGTPTVNNTTSAAVNRVVGRIDSQGNVDTSTAITGEFSGGEIRGAVTEDGSTIWVSGSSNNSTGGVRTVAFGAASGSTAVSAPTDSPRALGIFDGQLYAASFAPGPALSKVGTGTPQTSGQTLTPLVFPPGLLTPSAGSQFFLADLSASEPGLDTVYVADESAGLRKYSMVGGVLQHNDDHKIDNRAIRGLTGIVSGGVVTLYASNTETTNNDIWKVVDDAGWNQPLPDFNAMTFFLGTPGAAFRGLAMAPESVVAPAVVADYGDAPDSYQTLAASGGPSHGDTGPRLGASRDIENDGQPSVAASGDDISDLDDEDGITFLTPLLASAAAPHTASLTVTASAAGRLDAWIDFNANGAFDDASERITAAGGTAVVAGANLLSVTIPAGAAVGASFARFRLSTAGGLLPVGTASDGEIEDYALTLASDAGANVAIQLPAGGGNYTLETSGGQLRLQRGATILFATPANTINSLDIAGGAGDVIDVTGNVTLPGTVGLTSQQINFPAAASVIAAATVNLDAPGGAIVDSSPLSASVSATSLTLAAGSGITLGTSVGSLTASVTGAGAINITEAGALTVTSATTANGAISIATSSLGDLVVENVDAGASSVNLTVNNGNLVSGPSDAGVADIVGGTMLFTLQTANRNFGDLAGGNRLEINATQLRLATAVAGNDAFIVDLAGGLQMNDSSMGAGGSVFDLLVQNGSLTSVVGGNGDVRADNVIVAVTGAGSTLGVSTAAPLEIQANTSAAAATAGGNIFLRDTMTDFPLGLINAGTGTVDLFTNAGAILDTVANGAAVNIIASAASLRGQSGVGTAADPIETQVSTLAARNASTTAGSIHIANSVGGLLTIGTVNSFAGIVNNNTSGQISVTNASPLTVAANITSGGAIAVTATDSVAAGDDMTVNAGIAIQSTGSSVTLNAGDNASIGAGALLAAATTVTINVDSGNADAGTGATLSLPAAANVNAASAILNGSTDNDTFNVAPDNGTPLTVNGFAPSVAPGDVLNLDISGLTNPGLAVSDVNSGAWSFGNAAAVAYSSIEQVNVTPAPSTYHLTIDMNGPLGAANGGAADTITVQVDGANLEVIVAGVNGGAPVFSGPQANIDSLTVLGSGDVDLLNINEATGGLPVFANPAAGAAAGHTSPTFTSHTGYDQAGATPVDVHFNGGGGNDQLLVNLTGSHALVYTSDAIDTSKSGNVGIGSGASLTNFGTRQLGISFEDLFDLSLAGGVGSSLIVDASNSPAADLTSLTVAAGANPADGITEITPNASSASFASAVMISGITGLVVRSGDGSDTLDFASLDSSAALFSEVVLDADSLTHSDASADTIRVQSTSGLNIPVTMLGGRGNDTFQVHTNPLGGSIDGIAGPVSISPNAGPFVDDPAATDSDALFVDDRGDTDNDNVTITETIIEGLTGFAGAPDIAYRSIDTLNVTGTAGNNAFDTTLNPGSDLDTVTVSGFSGDDQFYLDLNTADTISNAVSGLVSVTLNGDAGQDVFGQTPDNAPHAGSGLPVIPPPPAPLPAPIFTPPAFPGVNRGKLAPSTTTTINVNGGLNNSASAGASPVANATQGNEYGPAFDVVNIDMSPSAANPSTIAVVTTVGGSALTHGYKLINFGSTEAINLCDQNKLTRVAMGDLYARGTEGNDIIQFGLTGRPNVASTRVNGFIYSLAVTQKTVAYGRGGNDQIIQGNLNKPAEFYGETGDDYLAGYNFNDLLVGGAGYDRVLGGAGVNELWGDNLQLDPSTVEATDGPDTLTGGSGIDRMYGGGGNDTINGAAGSDYVFGGGGDDTIDGGQDDDRLYGGAGNDTIGGGDGNDLLAGNDGDDKLYGKAGNDVLIGGLGADLLFGEEGNDLLIGGTLSFAGPPAGNDASTVAGDANDQAMAALLAIWAAGGLPPGLTAPDDGSSDSLGGMAGDDTASPGAGDLGDWEHLLP